MTPLFLSSLSLHFLTCLLSSLSATEYQTPSAPFCHSPRLCLFLPTLFSTVALAHTLEKPFQVDDVVGTSEDDWMAPDPVFKVQRTVSLGDKQYGFTSLGRGFNWLAKEEEERNRIRQQQSRSRSRQRNIETDDQVSSLPSNSSFLGGPIHREPEKQRRWKSDSIVPSIHTLSIIPSDSSSTLVPDTPTLVSPPPRTPVSSRPVSPVIPHPTSPRPPTRRRSSQKRVSLVAGRLHVIDHAPELAGNGLTPLLARHNSASSMLSIAASTRAPSPVSDPDHATYLGSHSINDYVIEGEAGRGAYGLVKRARERLSDGSLGVSLLPPSMLGLSS